MTQFLKTLRLIRLYPFVAVMLLFGMTLAPAYAQSVSSAWTSLNWAGYVAEGGTYTAVTGSWQIPTVPADQSGAGDAQWVGIGGMGKNQDLIQAGTQAYLSDGTVQYFAWYELLPSYAVTVSLDVHPGDRITATITETATDTWQITIRNTTTGESYQHVVSYHSSLSSAEWIEEMVSNANGELRPIDHFGSVSFSSAFATENGTYKPLGMLQSNELFTMQNPDGSILADASSVGADKVSFTVSRTATAVSSALNSSMNYSTAPGHTIIVPRQRGTMTVTVRSGTTSAATSAAYTNAAIQQLLKQYAAALTAHRRHSRGSVVISLR